MILKDNRDKKLKAQRYKQKFSYFPTWVKDRLIWLQTYYVLQEYGYLYYCPNSCSWITIEKFLNRTIYGYF